MAKRSHKLSVGDPVRVLPGTTMPEFDNLHIDGYEGTVLEVRGRAAQKKYIVKWSDETLAGLPEDYVAACEQGQLASDMACLKADRVEPA